MPKPPSERLTFVPVALLVTVPPPVSPDPPPMIPIPTLFPLRSSVVPLAVAAPLVPNAVEEPAFSVPAFNVVRPV